MLYDTNNIIKINFLLFCFYVFIKICVRKRQADIRICIQTTRNMLQCMPVPYLLSKIMRRNNRQKQLQSWMNNITPQNQISRLYTLLGSSQRHL